MIAWLVQSACDLPALPAAAWLSPPERERLSSFKVAKRRDDWLLGRWTAKRLAQTVLARLDISWIWPRLGSYQPLTAPLSFRSVFNPQPSALSPP